MQVAVLLAEFCNFGAELLGQLKHRVHRRFNGLFGNFILLLIVAIGNGLAEQGRSLGDAVMNRGRDFEPAFLPN